MTFFFRRLTVWPKVLALTSLFAVFASGAGGTRSAPAPKADPQIQKLQAVLRKDPENFTAHARLGMIHMKRGEYDQAIEHLKEASAQQPTPANLSSLAEAYRRNKDYLDEIRTLEVLAQTQPKDAGVQELLGKSYLTTNNFDKSAEHYRKAIKLDHKRLSAYDGLYDVFAKSNNNYERRALLTDMQKAFGETPQVVTKLCRFYTQDNFIEKGREMCLKAVTLDPDIPDNHVFLALDYKDGKEVEQSLKIIQTAAKRFAKSEFAQYTAGTMNDEMKNYESARFYYRRCVKADPASDRCWAKLGQAALQLKDYQESLDAFRKACRLNSHAHYTEFRNATTTVRIWRVSQWTDKFSNAVENCGLE
jgi:tetratricopeptide (TPR) repeat protein